MQDNPSYTNVVEEVSRFLMEKSQQAIDHGIKKENIWIDPGIGFGKNLMDNLFQNVRKLIKIPIII